MAMKNSYDDGSGRVWWWWWTNLTTMAAGRCDDGDIVWRWRYLNSYDDGSGRVWRVTIDGGNDQLNYSHDDGGGPVWRWRYRATTMAAGGCDDGGDELFARWRRAGVMMVISTRTTMAVWRWWWTTHTTTMAAGRCDDGNDQFLHDDGSGWVWHITMAAMTHGCDVGENNLSSL